MMGGVAALPLTGFSNFLAAGATGAGALAGGLVGNS